MSDFKAKMHQNPISARGLPWPRLCWGSLQRSPDPLAGFMRAYFQEEGTTGEERERKWSGGGREASPKKSLNRPWFTFS